MSDTMPAFILLYIDDHTPNGHLLSPSGLTELTDMPTPKKRKSQK